ncbi:MAG: TlpA family protein disulfide reductase [Acidiferrobacterales bacterium]
MHRILITAMGFAVMTIVTIGPAPAISDALAAAADSPSPSANSPPKPGFSFLPYDQRRPLPGFEFLDGDGRVLTLANFRGKIVLLNVWATWCPPCREEMPTLGRLQAKLGGPDFEVIALSVDQEGVPAVKDFYQKHGIEALRIYVEESGKPPPALKILGLPTTLLIDRQGKEIGWTMGPAEWDTPKVETFIRWYLHTR